MQTKCKEPNTKNNMQYDSYLVLEKTTVMYGNKNMSLCAVGEDHMELTWNRKKELCVDTAVADLEYCCECIGV